MIFKNSEAPFLTQGQVSAKLSQRDVMEIVVIQAM
jgi:hypothetical protein